MAVSVQETDYLDQDPPLRGQNYVCLSFLSPEDVLKRKDVYFFEKFLGGFSKDMSEFFDRLNEKYKDEADLIKTIKDRYSYVFNPTVIHDEYNFFVNQNGASLEAEFHETNQFNTSIRGIKVRGIFDTLKEAEIRAQVLKRIDNRFHVYVAQVGCWCPWSPNPDDIGNQEYAETHLNTLMKNYRDNQEKKDMFFEERKRDLQFKNVKNKLVEEDPWSKNKDEQQQPDAPPSVTPVETQAGPSTSSV